VQVLGNALKFSRGRAPAQISLTWHEPASQTGDATGGDQCLNPGMVGATCCFSITDNGVGFKPEQAQALFKVFGKLHPAREFEGLGLGLVTCRKLIERLGGSIGITGALGAGCCVTICLPLAHSTP